MARYFLFVVLTLLPSAPMARADELARGRALFANCVACHSREPGQTGMAGPNLAHLGGRLVGSDPDFDYSPVLRTARDQGLTWDKARLEAFLADPEAMFPGLWMSAPGVRAAEDRAALAAYLVQPAP
jgi:cytochrome c